MSDYPTKLPVPHALLMYNATITTLCRAGDKTHRRTSGVCDYISVPEGMPCKPLVTVQAHDLGRRDNGPCWVWDCEADQGRGVWVLYDPEIHEVPESCATLPEAEPKRPALDLSTHSEVELSQSADAPTTDDPPDCDYNEGWAECDEPSYLDEEDEDEDYEIAG